LLENRIGAVPQRHREAQQLPVVGHAGQAVLAPSIRARASLLVAEVVPRVTPVTVVFPDRSPLPFREIRTPLPPRHPSAACGLESRLLFRHARLPPAVR